MSEQETRALSVEPTNAGRELRRYFETYVKQFPPGPESDHLTDLWSELVTDLPKIEAEAAERARLSEPAPLGVALAAFGQFAGDVLATGALRHRAPHPTDRTKCAACRLKDRARDLLQAEPKP